MDFSQLADSAALDRTVAAVTERGIQVEVVPNAAAALARVQALIPAGVSVMTGASVTLKDIGLEGVLKDKTHAWRNLKDAIMAEPDRKIQGELRRQAVLADWYLGSVHAVAQTGEILIASKTGSQLPAYAFSSPNVLWIVGTQKIVPTVADGLKRIHDYIIPHEEERMRAMTNGAMGTDLGKLLIFEREAAFLGRRVTLLLVKESVGD